MKFKPLLMHGLLLAGYTILGLVMTWPVACNMSTQLPGGAGDPLLTSWYLGHDISRYLSLDFRNFFDGNTFFPNPLSLACSEHFIATALLGVPFYLLSGGDIVFVNNALIILSFVLTAWGMHLLVRRLTGDHAAAVLAAIIFTFPPVKIGQVEHLHMLTTYWIPFVFLFLHRFLETRRLRDGLLFTLFFILNALTTIFYMILVTFGIFVFAVVMLPRIVKGWRALVIPGAVSVMFVVLVLTPVLKPYFELHEQFQFKRGVMENVIGSAKLSSYLAVPSWQGKNLYYGRVCHFNRFDDGHSSVLFPGVIAVFCAGTMLVMALRRKFKWKAEHTFYMVLTLLTFLITFGPAFDVAGGIGNPVFGLFFKFFPGAQGMRVPSRFGILLMFGLAVMAAYAVQQMMRTAAPRSRALLFVLPAVCVLEYCSVPIALEPVPDLKHVPAVYSWLKARPGRTAVLELPADNFWHNAKYVFLSQCHRKDIVNGYSSYSPAFFNRLYIPSAGILEPEIMESLRRVGVSYVIVHRDLMNRQDYRDFTNALARCAPGMLTPVTTLGSDSVYEVTGHRPIQPLPSSLADTEDKVCLMMPTKVKAEELCHGAVELAGPVPETITGTLTVPMNRILQVRFTARDGRRIDTFKTRLADSPLSGRKLYPFNSEVPKEPGTYDVSILSGNREITGSSMTVGNFLKTSRNPGTMLAEIIPACTSVVATVSRPAVLNVKVKNNGDTLWMARFHDSRKPGKYEVKLGARLFMDGREVMACRGILLHDVSPGQETDIELRLPATVKPGRYRVKLDMVNEFVAWFESGGSAPVWIELVVE